MKFTDAIAEYKIDFELLAKILRMQQKSQKEQKIYDARVVNADQQKEASPFNYL